MDPEETKTDEELELESVFSVSKSAKRRRSASTDRDTLSDNGEPIVNISNFTGPFRVWIENRPIQDEICRIFRGFLKRFRDERERPKYIDSIRSMCRENRSNLDIDFKDIANNIQNIAMWLVDYPTKMLELLDEAAMEVVEAAFPDYRRIRDEIFVRIYGIPVVDQLRDLREAHLGNLVNVFGVVTKRTAVFPQLKSVRYRCLKCNSLSVPMFFACYDKDAKPPERCGICSSRGPFKPNQEDTFYRNFQRITLQESPSSVPAGRVPRRKQVVLTNDLINSVRPGEEVGITGIFKHQFDMTLNTQNGFPVFATIIEANHVLKLKDEFDTNLTDDDKKRIRNFAKKSNIYDIIINSVAPSIHGHRNIKEALALALFGGTAKTMDQGRHQLRGDINVLILGDPGTAKSQFLKYVEKAAPRAIYSTGKGASGVGLTAAVTKDPNTREWVLEGGALVLADQGVCLIDEFDKMNDSDRTSIHEAMEQQTISISKAGIVATLQARCSVIAVANPVKERYDSSATFLENVDLADTIISRFDVICIVKDTVDEIEDEKLAKFVIGSHVNNHPLKKKENTEIQSENEKKRKDKNNPETIPQHLLKKYIQFAKNSVRPKINNINTHKVTKAYVELRKESMRDGAIPVGIRHIESIIRMSEARAKIHLREYVSNDDIDVAIGVAVSSFIDTQKFSVMRSMRKKFHKFLTSVTDYNELLFHLLTELFRNEQQFQMFLGMDKDGASREINAYELQSEARKLEIYDLSRFYKSSGFKDTFEYDKKRSVIRKI